MSLNLSAIALGVNSYLMNSVNHDISHKNRMFNEMKLKKRKRKRMKVKTFQSRRLLQGLIKQREIELSCDISTGQ